MAASTAFLRRPCREPGFKHRSYSGADYFSLPPKDAAVASFRSTPALHGERRQAEISLSLGREKPCGHDQEALDRKIAKLLSSGKGGDASRARAKNDARRHGDRAASEQAGKRSSLRDFLTRGRFSGEIGPGRANAGDTRTSTADFRFLLTARLPKRGERNIH
jgi:hypothetical protein